MSAAIAHRPSPGRLPARRRSMALLAGLVVLSLATVAREAGAQVMTGILTGSVQGATGEPLEGAVITVGRRVGTTDAAGQFRMSGLDAGPNVATVRRLGYQMRTFPVMIERGTTTPPIEVVLIPVPQGLEPVMVQARRDARDLQLTGFYDRQRAGIGRFITRDQIERRRSSSFMEVLRSMVPGMQLTGTGRTPNRSVQLRNSRCAPLIVLDGFPMYGSGFDLTSINPVTVLGIEVYSGPATVPSRFRSLTNSETCGVIAIWFGVKKPGGLRTPTAEEFAYADSAKPVSAERPAYGAHEVDEPARVDPEHLVSPEFPDSLYARGIAAEVLAQFIVDASGFVLPGSIHMDSESDPAFHEAVLRALAISRFIPAKKGGARVRQVMVLPYRFVLREPTPSPEQGQP